VAKPTRIFFVADLHGSAICWRKFINAAKVYSADVLLVGGDIAAKTLTPVLEDQGVWSANVEGIPRTAHSLPDLERLEAALRDRATVPFRTTAKQWQELLEDPSALDRVFELRSVEELGQWLSWAHERLRTSGVRLLVGLGNDDFTPMESVIAADPVAELTDEAILWIDDQYEVLTIPYSNPTPWKTHRELSEDQIDRKIGELAGRLERPEAAIYNIHVPPYNTPLDLAPRLDRALTKVMTPGGEAEMVHVGSRAVRSALERRQPLLALHGHIHESRGSTRFGRTLSVNCGSAYSEGALLGALVDLEGGRVRSSILTSG
jgi:uncharacterized protein